MNLANYLNFPLIKNRKSFTSPRHDSNAFLYFFIEKFRRYKVLNNLKVFNGVDIPFHLYCSKYTAGKDLLNGSTLRYGGY